MRRRAGDVSRLRASSGVCVRGRRRGEGPRQGSSAGGREGLRLRRGRAGRLGGCAEEVRAARICGWVATCSGVVEARLGAAALAGRVVEGLGLPVWRSGGGFGCEDDWWACRCRCGMMCNRGGVGARVKTLSRPCVVTSDGGGCGRRDLPGGIADLLPHSSRTDPAISASSGETLDLMIGR